MAIIKILSWMKKLFLIILTGVFVLAGVIAFSPYRGMLINFSIQKKSDSSFSLYVSEEGESISILLDSLKDSGKIHFSKWVSLMARIRGYDSARFGHYKIDSNLGAMQFLRKLSLGYEDPIRFRVAGYKNRDKYLQEISNFFPWSIDSLRKYLGNDSSWTHLIPNTYEIYWTTPPKGIAKRINQEYKIFWGNNRQAKADALGLSSDQIMVLASISQAETKVLEEVSRVAALYISRLRIGKRLESDPTAVYAFHELNPGEGRIRRVSRKITRIKHPYNTYYISGLPPSPIASVEPQIIDAVLQSIPKGEIYMCADPNRIGYHNFTSSFRQHLINSRKYHKSLNQRGILK